MKVGTHIKFSYEGNELEGRVIQADREVNIKLDSGYNIIVPSTALENVKELPIKKQEKTESERKQDPTLPKVTILHTGGTVASKVDYETGGVHSQFKPEELIAMFPEVLKIANISSIFIANMWSEDMRFAHYNILARTVFEEVKKEVRGVIVTHGTDLLHMSSSALAFALEDLNIPVVLVGSQRSSDRGSSDAKANLVGALRFITEEKIPGVFVAMHENSSDDSIAIHEGLHVRKNHSSRRDAFTRVNAPLFARVKEKVEILNKERAEQLKNNLTARPRLMPFNEELKIGIWKAHPQSYVEELKPYDSFDGLVIEASGLGHLPINGVDEFTKEQHPFIREKIGKLARKIPVAITTQAIFGRVNMNVYSTGRHIKELGVVGDGLDMMPEVAFVKLAWLLSNHKEKAKEKFSENIRGEITERLPLEDTHKGPTSFSS